MAIDALTDSLRGIQTCDDGGVSLGHVSRSLKDVLRGHTLRFEPVASLPNPYDADSLQFNPLARELIVPDTYDELVASASSDRRREQLQVFYQSEVNVHERHHDALRNEHQHLYLPKAFNSFAVPLYIVRDGATERLYRELLKQGTSVAHQLRKWELTHEGQATAAQLAYLRDEFDADSPFIEAIDHQQHIRELLDSGESVETYVANEDATALGTSYAHAAGQYLRSEAQRIWDLDIDQIIHRIYEYTSTDNVESRPNEMNPDHALLYSVFYADEDEIEGCTPEQQRELFLELVTSKAASHSSLHADGETEHLGHTEYLESTYDIRDPEQIEAEIRRMNLKYALEEGSPFLVPIVASSYPGQPANRTLWSVLQSLYATTLPNGQRHLFVEAETFEWARGTKLLEMAIDLWRLRDLLFVPAVEEIRTASRYDPIKLLTAIDEGEMAGMYREPDPETVRERIAERVNLWGFPRSAYQPLLDDLNTLGKAIVTEDDSRIARFY